jgi:hypothetical protein
MSVASYTPGYVEAVNMAINRALGEMHVCLPGEVVSYDPGTQSATVQPTIKVLYVGKDTPELLPQIQQVPVVFPATANAWVRLPLAAGDTVMLHFAERSLNDWLLKGGHVDPVIGNRFCLSDAIAVPGLRPQSAAIVAKGAATSLEVVNGQGWLEITQAGKFKLSNSGGDLLKLLQTISTDIKALITDVASFQSAPGTTGGPLIPNATYATDLAQLATDLSNLSNFLP